MQLTKAPTNGQTKKTDIQTERNKEMEERMDTYIEKKYIFNMTWNANLVWLNSDDLPKLDFNR